MRWWQRSSMAISSCSTARQLRPLLRRSRVRDSSDSLSH
ncbi:hypothetical protein M6B38_307510 [Iris pallida]|uniref:Uncharacterized protein n=1 Tax=Iris pallida TaxID=29817 RepID=A0AAX6HJ89_IRIPA|nr:hypothetical protein M6B38_307510 [Iris pallida]